MNLSILRERVLSGLYDDVHHPDSRALGDAREALDTLVAEIEYLRGERADTVAWLRSTREASPRPVGCWEADMIERGEHHRKEEK